MDAPRGQWKWGPLANPSSPDGSCLVPRIVSYLGTYTYVSSRTREATFRSVIAVPTAQYGHSPVHGPPTSRPLGAPPVRRPLALSLLPASRLYSFLAEALAPLSMDPTSPRPAPPTHLSLSFHVLGRANRFRLGRALSQSFSVASPLLAPT